MRHLAFVAILVALSGCQSPTSRPATPPRELTQIERDFLGTSYVFIRQEREIPLAIRSLVTPKPHRLANPGEEYNDTDFKVPTKPMVQLVYAGTSSNSAFVLYRIGSIVGPLQQVLIARTEGGEVTAYCTLGVGAAKALELHELKELVSHGLPVWREYACH